MSLNSQAEVDNLIDWLDMFDANSASRQHLISSITTAGFQVPSYFKNTSFSNKLTNLVSNNFDALDYDKDGFISKDDIDSAIQDPQYKNDRAAMVATLYEAWEKIEECADDEWGDENSGVSKNDLETILNLDMQSNENNDLKIIGKVFSLHLAACPKRLQTKLYTTTPPSIA